MRLYGLMLIVFCSLPLCYAESRLRNLSTLGYIDQNGVSAGFIIVGDQPAKVVVLGERYGSEIDPVLRVTDLSASTTYGENDNWSTATDRNEITRIIGREPWHENDAALVLNLNPGVYVAVVRSDNGKRGNGIVAVTIDRSGAGQ